MLDQDRSGIEIDFKGPIVFLHGIRTDRNRWNDWAGFLRNGDNFICTGCDGRGYITFAPNYNYEARHSGLASAVSRQRRPEGW